MVLPIIFRHFHILFKVLNSSKKLKLNFYQLGIKKKALTKRWNNCHQKQDDANEPSMARAFFDTHNATSFTLAFKRTVSLGRSRGSECSSLDFEFETISPSLSLLLLSPSRQFHPAFCASRNCGDAASRSFRMLANSPTEMSVRRDLPNCITAGATHMKNPRRFARKFHNVKLHFHFLSQRCYLDFLLLIAS